MEKQQKPNEPLSDSMQHADEVLDIQRQRKGEENPRQHVKGEQAKRAMPRSESANAGRRSRQIKPHASPGLPGDPWLPLGGTGARAP